MEFSQSDPPPSNFAPPSNFVQPANFAATSNGAQTVVPGVNHPSYQEMITSAIIALNEKDGSSRQAISKYIENEFMIPSISHAWELTQQLRRMKNSGQLVLVKHSYMLPGSIPAAAATTTTADYNIINHFQSQASDVPKKRPGRPPKLQPYGGPIGSSAPPTPVGFAAAAIGTQQMGEPTIGVPTTSLFGGLTSGALQFGAGHVSNAATIGAPVMSNVQKMAYIGGPVYDPGAVATVVPIEQIDGLPAKRRRGRPRKVDTVGVETESVVPLVVSAGPDSAVQNNDGILSVVVPPPTVLGKRVRGRPAKLNMMSAPMVNGGPKKGPGTGKRGWPKGRPRKNGVGAVVAVDGAGGGVLAVAKKPRQLSGKPLGRPKKYVSGTASLTSEIQLMAYQGLKARVEHYQSRIKTAVRVVKPYLNETAAIALGALQDLEELANMDILSVPVSVQSAPIDDLNAPVNVQDAAPENIQSTVEAASLTFQRPPSTAETAPVQQEPPLNNKYM